MARPKRASKTTAIERLSNLSEAISAHVDDDDDVLVTGPELINVDDSDVEDAGRVGEPGPRMLSQRKNQRDEAVSVEAAQPSDVDEEVSSPAKRRKKGGSCHHIHDQPSLT